MQLATNKVDLGRPEIVGVPFVSRTGRGDQRRRAVPLAEYFDQNRQPSLAGIVGRGSNGGSSTSDELNSGDDDSRSRRKLYVHWRSTTTNVVVAESLRLDRVDGATNGRRSSGSRLTASGRLHAIPVDHGGWYELLSADGHSTAPITTVGRLLDVGIEKFLVQQTIAATSASAATDGSAAMVDNGSIPRDVMQIAAGETLTLLKTDDRRHGKRGSNGNGFTQKAQSTRRIRCIFDRTGEVIDLSVEQRGVFSPIAMETAVAGVHRIRDVVRKFRLPVVVRMVCSGSGNRNGGGGSSDISTGSVLRLLSVEIEPAIHIVPLPSTIPSMSSSFDVIYVVPKRACVFVDQIPLSDDCSDRRRGHTSRPDVERSPPGVVDELCKRCEQLIGVSRTSSVICRILPSAVSSTLNSRSSNGERRPDNAKLDNSSTTADVQNTSFGRQPSVDSGTSSLTGGGPQTSTTDVGLTEAPSTGDAAENRLMDEIDIIYDAIRGFGVESPPRGRPLAPTQRSASYCFRSRHQSIEPPKNFVEHRPAVGLGGDLGNYRRQPPQATSIAKVVHPAMTARRQHGNAPQRSMTLDANFVIVSPRRVPSMRSASQPPRLDRQLTVAPTSTPTGPPPPRTVADSRGNRSPAPSRQRGGGGQSNGVGRLLIGFESSEFEDDSTPDQHRHQVENEAQRVQMTESIYDSVAAFEDVDPKRPIEGSSQPRDAEVDRTKEPGSSHRHTARPQSYAGTATASLTDVTATSTTATRNVDGQLYRPHPTQQQQLKRYPSDFRRTDAVPPMLPSRHVSPSARPRSAGTQPTITGNDHITGHQITPPSLPLKSSSASSFGGALGALSRTFISTVRRVGATRSANGKTLVLNQTDSRANGVAGENYGGVEATTAKFGRSGSNEQSDVVANENRSKMWWNIDELRVGQRDQLVDSSAVDPAANNAFTTPSNGAPRKRFSYAEPASKEYSVRLFVKRF